jgi:hypothetical protein
MLITDSEGKGFASIRATARLAGVQHSTLARQFQGVGQNGSKLARMLMGMGFSPSTFSTDRFDGKSY